MAVPVGVHQQRFLLDSPGGEISITIGTTSTVYGFNLEC